MKLLIPTMAFAASLVATSAIAQEPSSEAFEINALSCFDVISLADDDATFVIGMLLGFDAASNSMSEFSAADIVAKIEAFDATCGENPEMNALEAM